MPTSNGYTSKICLQCPHTSRKRDVVLGSDWRIACSLYTVAHQCAFDRRVPPDDNSIDVILILSKIHDRLTNDLATSASVFFIAHGMDLDTLVTRRWTGLTLPHT